MLINEKFSNPLGFISMGGALAFLILTFLLTSGTGKIIVGILFVVSVILCFAVHGFIISDWATILGIVLILGCFIFIRLGGFRGKSYRVFRHWR